MTNPDLALLDEPTEGLAPLIVSMLEEQIMRLKESGLTVILAASYQFDRERNFATSAQFHTGRFFLYFLILLESTCFSGILMLPLRPTIFPFTGIPAVTATL
jgi:hypothetical protein